MANNRKLINKQKIKQIWERKTKEQANQYYEFLNHMKNLEKVIAP